MTRDLFKFAHILIYKSSCYVLTSKINRDAKFLSRHKYFSKKYNMNRSSRVQNYFGASKRVKVTLLGNQIWNINWVQWVNCRLNYTRMKITQTYYFIGYVYPNCVKIS